MARDVAAAARQSVSHRMDGWTVPMDGLLIGI